MPVKEAQPTKELVSPSNNSMLMNNNKAMEFQCTLCNMQLDLPTYFTHSKEVHGVFSCLYCLRCFKFSKELMVHLTREHKVTPQKFSSGAEFLDRGGTDTTLLCVECNKVFQSETLITFMKYHIHECRKSTGICPKCGSIHPLSLLGEHIVQCQGSMNVNLHGSTTITTSQLRNRDNSCKYCGKKFSPSKIAAHMRACSVRSTKSTYNVWNSSSINKHETLNHTSCESSPKSQSLDGVLLTDDLHHPLKPSITVTGGSTTTSSGSGKRRDSSVLASMSKLDEVLIDHADPSPLLTATFTKTASPGSIRNKKIQKFDSSSVSVSPIVPIKSGAGTRKSSSSSGSDPSPTTAVPPVTTATQDDRKVSLQRKRQSSVSVVSSEPPPKSSSSRRDSSSVTTKPVIKQQPLKSPSVSASGSPPKTSGRGRNKVQLQFQQVEVVKAEEPPIQIQEPAAAEAKEESMDLDVQAKELDEDQLSTSTDVSSLVPKTEAEEEEEEEDEEDKLDPLLREENDDKRLGILISELSDKLEYFHRIFNEQQMQQRLLKQQEEQILNNPEKTFNGDDSVALNPPPQELPSYELIVNYSLNGRTDVGILNDMLLKSSVDCPYCKLVRLIRIDKRQLVIHMLSKHSWDLRVLRKTPSAPVFSPITDSRSSLVPIKSEENQKENEVQDTEHVKLETSSLNNVTASTDLESENLDISKTTNQSEPSHDSLKGKLANSVSCETNPAGKERGENSTLKVNESEPTADDLDVDPTVVVKQEEMESECSDASEIKETSAITPVVSNSLSPLSVLPFDVDNPSESDNSKPSTSSVESKTTTASASAHIQRDDVEQSVTNVVLNTSTETAKASTESGRGVENMDVDKDSKEQDNLEKPHSPCPLTNRCVEENKTEPVENQTALSVLPNVDQPERAEGNSTSVNQDDTKVAVLNENNNNNSVLPSIQESEMDTQVLSVLSEFKSEENEGKMDSSSSTEIPCVPSLTEDQQKELEADDVPLDLNWTVFKLTLLEKVFRSQSIVYTFTGEMLGEFGEIPCECLICGFITESQKNLFPHWRRTHRGVAMKCTMCKGRFLFAGALYSHLCLGTPEPLSLKEKEIEEEEGDSEETVGLRYQCSICENQLLPGFFNYMVHLRKDHNKCELCLETLSTQKELEHHMKKHKLNHFCWKCNLSYCAKPNFMTHLFWKHGTESVDCSKCLKKKWPHIYHFCVPSEYFSCDVCGLYFTRPKALIVHRRLHTGEKLRRCPKTSCQERFISKKLLQKHLETVHVKIPPAPAPILPPPPPALPPPEVEKVDEQKQGESDVKSFPTTEGSPGDELATTSGTTLTTDGLKGETETPNEETEQDRVQLPSSDDELMKYLPSSDLNEPGGETTAERMDVEQPVINGDESIEPIEAEHSEKADKSKKLSNESSLITELTPSKNGELPFGDGSEAETQQLRNSKSELNGEVTPMDLVDDDSADTAEPVTASSSPHIASEDNDISASDYPLSFGNKTVSDSPLTPIKLTIQTKHITDERRGHESPLENSRAPDVDLTNSNSNDSIPMPTKISKPEPPVAKPFNLAEIQGPNLSEDESDSDNENVGNSASTAFSSIGLVGAKDDRSNIPGSENTKTEMDSLCTANHNGNQEPMLGSLFSSPPLKKDDIPSPNSSPRLNLDNMDLSLVMSGGSEGGASTGNLLAAPSLNSSTKNPNSMDIDDGVNRFDMADSLSTVGVLSSLDMAASSSSLLGSGDKMKNGDDFGSMSPLLPPLDDFDFSVPEIPTFEENHLPEHIIQENALFSIQHEHDYCSPVFNNNVGGKRKSSSPASSFGPGHLFHGHATRPGGEVTSSSVNKSPSPGKAKKLKVRKPSPKKSSPKKRRRSRSSSSSSSSSSSCSSCGSNCSCSSSSSGSSSSSSSEDSDSETSPNESFDSKKQKTKKLTKQVTKVIPKIKTVLPLPSPKKDPVTVKIVNNGKLPKPKKEKPPKPPTVRKNKRAKVAKMTLKLGKAGGAIIDGAAGSENVPVNPEDVKPEPEEPYILESDLETDDSGSEEIFHKKQLTEVIGSVQLPVDKIWMMGNEKYLLKLVRGVDDLEELRPPPPPPPPTPPPPPPKAKRERVKYSVKGGNSESKLKVRNVPIKPLIFKRNVNSGGSVKSEGNVGNGSVPMFKTSLTSGTKHNTITVSRGPPNAATTPPASSLLKGAKGGHRGKANQSGGKAAAVPLDDLDAVHPSAAEDSTLSPAGNKRAPRGRKSAGKVEKVTGGALAKQGKAAAKATEAYDEKLYCFCQSPHDYVSQMIGCDGKDCQYKWFHFECVGIFIPPKGKWFCSECREARRQKAREKLMNKQKEKQQELLLQEQGPE